MSSDNFFQNWDGGKVWKVFLYPPVTFQSTIFDLLAKIEGPYIPILKEKLSRDILDPEEYLLGTILSHIWAFLEYSYGFWKVFYTRPPPSGVPFLTDKQKLKAPTPQFWKKILWRHDGSSRVSSWDHFKPYLSHFGQVVWVLEGFLYWPVTFKRPIFGR